MRDYHDHEWGRPIAGDAAWFERLSLEAFQSGLSWATILRKRPAFRAAFDGFDPDRVAAYDDADVERLMADAGIVRNRAKVLAAIANAGALVAFEQFVVIERYSGFTVFPLVDWADLAYAVGVVGIAGPVITLVPTLLLTRKYVKV
jgi:DNA-3-methyladenine glycosylase I